MGKLQEPGAGVASSKKGGSTMNFNLRGGFTAPWRIARSQGQRFIRLSSSFFSYRLH